MVIAKKKLKRLTNTVRIFSKDIALEFGINKYAHIIMKAGKLDRVDGMKLPSEEVIPELESAKILRYFGS